MKKLIILFVLTLTVSFLFAQKVDLDRLYTTLSSRNLPKTVINPSYTTFSVEISESPLLSRIYGQISPTSINVEGFNRVESDGDIQVDAGFGDLIITSVKVEERVSEDKDKEGKVIRRNYFYTGVVNYTFEAGADVFLGHNKDKSFVLASRNETKIFRTTEFGKYSDANNYVNNNQIDIRTRLISDNVNSCLKDLNTRIAYEYSYFIITSNELFWKMDSKKHEENENFNNACNVLAEKIKTISPYEIPEDFNLSVTSTIEYFNSLPTKYNDPKEKAHKKIRYGAYYNLAKYYMLTEQFDMAEKFAKLLIANDYDPKDGEKILEEITKTKETYQKHKIFTNHFKTKAEQKN